MREPVTIWVAIGGILSTGVALLAVFFPGITPEMQAAVIAFGNAVILTVSILLARSQSTPTAAPVLPLGTAVTATEGVPAKVVRINA